MANEAVFPNLGKYFGDGDALGYAYLATSIYTHNRTAALLAKYYSLGAELDEYSDIVEISHERTLGEWLTFAEDQSRRNIAMLQESGIDATACARCTPSRGSRPAATWRSSSKGWSSSGRPTPTPACCAV